MRGGRATARSIGVFGAGVVVAWTSAIGASAVGCGAVEAAAPVAPDGAAFEAAAPVHGITACGLCEAEACARDRRDCAAETTCTKYLSCADACGSIDGGSIDPACEAACPRPADPAGSAAFVALSQCRTRGAGAVCEACGGGLARYRSPLLKQVCGPAPSPPPAVNVCEGEEEQRAKLEECTKCQYERCCETRAACAASASCSGLRNCVRVCPNLDAKATDQCHTDFAAGLPATAQNFACLSVRCAAACGAPNACARCSNTYCGDEAAALKGSADGYLFTTCTDRCVQRDKTPCLNACIAKFPSLRQALVDALLCDAKYCSECELKKD